MKLDIMRNRLLEALNDVMRAVSSKTTHPILTGIKIELTKNGLLLTGSDSDMTIQSFIHIEENGEQVIRVVEEGAIVLQARMFYEIIRKLPSNDVTITVGPNHQTHIHAGKSDFHLIGMDSTEYPLIGEPKDAQTFSLKEQELRTIIRETVFAVSTSETRPVLTGVKWSLHHAELVCTATDSHRLARTKIALASTQENEYSLVIPGKALSELSKIIEDTEQTVWITSNQQQVMFKTSQVVFVTRLLEGSYPDTSRLIPQEFQTTLELEGKRLFQAIDRASLMAKEERNNIVRLKSLSEESVEISSHSPEIGHVEEEVSTSLVEGEEISISFSAKYMMDGLKAFGDQPVKIQFTGGMRPFVIHSTNDDRLLQLIVPVRTY